eukprot:TRINITY_DN4635_c0_g1_i1.p1 TRINITY_DN4635_c0_g1~~TRINITY_DN4635_c0_g1_i1.p1  ORF type:complete len:371 (-),score=62.91 TRINITY_DN4635_c0_g1_i1:27-1139(-)
MEDPDTIQKQVDPTIQTTSPPSRFEYIRQAYNTIKFYTMETFYSYYSSQSGSSALSDSKIIMMGGKSYETPFESFHDDFKKLLWFSYRRGFSEITPSTWTTDLGWGCMLRSGQMMLGTALLRHLTNDEGATDETVQTRVLRNFEDSSDASFSVHKIAQTGLKFGKNIGEWFGPSTIAQVFETLIKVNHPEGVSMYLSNESCLYKDEIMAISQKDPQSTWKPLFIMIPLRLGLNTFNEIYITPLKNLLQVPHSVGIVGGKPRSAMYFVGYQDDNVFYLDPHLVQPTVPMKTAFQTETYHPTSALKMPFTQLDPSLSVGFFCDTRSSFEDFWTRMSEISRQDNACLGVVDCAPAYRHSATPSSDIEDDIVIL